LDLTQLVTRYFDCIRARDIDGLIALYADDAIFVLPNGREFEGAKAIREMQLGVFAHGAPVPSPSRIISHGDGAAVEIQAKLADGSVRRTANFYQVNDAGKIQRLSVYMQGG
jgi:ketosteroid isomerase-like protein